MVHKPIIGFGARPHEKELKMQHKQRISFGRVELIGDLHIPKECLGLVIFAHGSGSSRLSPRNRLVARILNERGMATLLVDLLMEEERDELKFDMKLLSERLERITKWAEENGETKLFPMAYFGASTGAAAALIAAAKMGNLIRAVVSRGGRPDLAGEYLAQVVSPTLLIVGELDTEVIGLNRKAFDLLQCVKEFEIVPGATHLFEETGCLERAAELACKWFERHFRGEE